MSLNDKLATELSHFLKTITYKKAKKIIDTILLREESTFQDGTYKCYFHDEYCKSENFTGITIGHKKPVSGGGKSSLVIETLWKALSNKLNNAKHNPLKFDSISGIEYLDKIVDINQSPIGRTPRSNPATYTGAVSYTHLTLPTKA